jgi:hypothetical protein
MLFEANYAFLDEGGCCVSSCGIEGKVSVSAGCTVTGDRETTGER